MSVLGQFCATPQNSLVSETQSNLAESREGEKAYHLCLQQSIKEDFSEERAFGGNFVG